MKITSFWLGLCVVVVVVVLLLPSSSGLNIFNFLHIGLQTTELHVVHFVPDILHTYNWSKLGSVRQNFSHCAVSLETKFKSNYNRTKRFQSILMSSFGITVLTFAKQMYLFLCVCFTLKCCQYLDCIVLNGRMTDEFERTLNKAFIS
jgi:hypothetical protein